MKEGQMITFNGQEWLIKDVDEGVLTITNIDETKKIHLSDLKAEQLIDELLNDREVKDETN